ncbi:sugar kinase [Kitasatospora xanthocidica]|uniref:ROK family protein n=1 Tax=Kitasatospora xanthocidica TaxID=83382 RepID=UPI0016739A07|nr:ROK family protein [Kitasatospora xanthocidica]GHF92328.1 sugar kinase [Kitasatospora xanthocidica]
MTVIALDVGGTQIKAGVLAEDGSLIHGERRLTRAERGPDAVLDTVLACAVDLAGRYAPTAAGIAVPGIVDEASGTSVFAANLGWRQVPVRDWLEEALELPVAFGHDVRAGGLAEARLGAGRGCGSFLFVPVGTGIASAIVLDGEVLTGRGSAGELGHLTVRPGGERCPCGGRGCLETVASASAIARRYGAATGAVGVSAEDVRRRAESGDAVAAAVWREAVDALADGLSAAVTLLDPERIVVGGGLARAGAPYFDPLRAALAERSTFRTAPPIVPAELGHQAGCLGAALLAQDLDAARKPATRARRSHPIRRQTGYGVDG